MTLVDASERRGDAAVRQLLAEGGRAAEAWRVVGWEVDGALLACVGLSRTEGGHLELHALSGVSDAGTDASSALVEELAESANATCLVAETDAYGADFYRACGFSVERRADANRFQCLRVLDARPDATLRPALGLAELEAVIRNSWSAETSEDPDAWPPDNPARDQCAVTALVVRELLGGEILIANVVRDGKRLERHAWNRLASGVEVDLTRGQFRAGEELTTPRAAEPLMTEARSNAYALLSTRVRSALGL
jgi:hypothetical protein